MNKDEIFILSSLTLEQKQKIIIWSYDLGTHTLCYPKKLFWIFYKNIPIADENKNVLSFQNLSLAMDMLRLILKN